MEISKSLIKVIKSYLIIITICSAQTAYSQQNMKSIEKAIIKTATVNDSIDTIWWQRTPQEIVFILFGDDNKTELKPEGAIKISFSKKTPIGQSGFEGYKMLSFTSKRNFSFTWNAPLTHIDDLESGYHKCIVVDFKVISNGTTEVTLTHTGWPENKKWECVIEYFEAAWPEVLAWIINRF